MRLFQAFKKTIGSNTSPITYIVMGGMAARSLALAIESHDLAGAVVFILATIAALVVIVGCLIESKSLVSWSTMGAFMAELYIVYYNFAVGDTFRSISISVMFLLVCAYVYWTNSLNRLWSYTPGLD